MDRLTFAESEHPSALYTVRVTLQANTRIGPYRIEALIGTGGMGEVYRACDTRLNRTVAIKIIASGQSIKDEARQRFEREAHLIAALDHPHICRLYDVGRQHELDYLVMEYLEGETLAVRLRRGPLATEQALAFALQIAEALDRAHRSGIIHRDLKPANVMLTRDGARIFDFGLAKNTRVLQASAGSSLVTATQSPTAENTIVGTLQYMSPEQLQGREADARSDVFAFGAVLYEMVAGRRAFDADSQVNAIAAILERDPCFPMSRTASVPGLDRIARICLAKNPDNRWQSAADLAHALRWVGEFSAPQSVRPGRRWPIAALAAATVCLVLALVVWLRAPVVQLAEPVQFTLGAADPASPWMGIPAVSPDGQKISYLQRDSVGNQTLWVRNLGALEPQRLAAADDTTQPFWSPDSRSVGFSQGGKLRRVELSGGPPQVICAGRSDLGASWGPDGVIVFSPNNRGPLFRVPATGGEPVEITKLNADRQENSHRRPIFLPGGRKFIFSARSSIVEHTAIYAGSLDSAEIKRLLTIQSNADYAGPGYLLFAREGVLYAQPFDADQLQLKGPAHAVINNVRHALPSATAAFSVSADGSVLTYRSGDMLSQIFWFDRKGRKLSAVGAPAEYSHPRLSPDGKRIGIVRHDDRGNRDIWVLDADRGTPTRLTFHPSIDWWPVWSPDGRRIIFSSDRDGYMYEKTVDSAREERQLPASAAAVPEDWSSDGRWLAFHRSGADLDLWFLNLENPVAASRFAATQFREVGARFSPDGRWVAYTTDESGASQIYVANFSPDGVSAVKMQVSTAGGTDPRWRADGKELFYLDPRNYLVSAKIVTGEKISAGRPETLFQLCDFPPSVPGYRDSFQVSPDGSRFLANCTADPERQRYSVIVHPLLKR